jgi:nucleoid DNA-binding protein
LDGSALILEEVLDKIENQIKKKSDIELKNL